MVFYIPMLLPRIMSNINLKGVRKPYVRVKYDVCVKYNKYELMYIISYSNNDRY